MLLRTCLLSSLVLAGCVDAEGDTTERAVTCASSPVESWTGSAGRVNQDYPDDVAADVTWTRVSTNGCVDRYQPSGTVHYTFAVPGAQCSQTMTPTDHAIGAGDGWLEIDRTTSPATYTGRGATTWSVTWTCGADDRQAFDGGGAWFEATGAIGGRVEGMRTEDDGRQCGRGQSSLPCDYVWGFDPGAP